jgi:hypothetical protein
MPVRERGHDMPVDVMPVAAPAFPPEAPVGWYEAVICDGCGHTSFWAHDYASIRAPQLSDPCPDCADNRALVVDEVPDLGEFRAGRIRFRLAPARSGAGRLLARSWNASLSAYLCQGCGAARWRARPDAVDPASFSDGESSPRVCFRCGEAQWLCALIDREGESVAPRAVAVFGNRTSGRFVLDVCRRCHAAEWYAVDRDELREDRAAGISRMRRVRMTGGGPYR